MSKWQPIETAPKDGTVVLLFCPEGIERLYVSPDSAVNYTLGFWGTSGGYHSDFGGWYSVESREDVWGHGGEFTGPMTEVECLEAAPTHWMTLPEPPEGA